MEPDPEEGEKKPPAKKNARAILESVCSDFENIDLPCPPKQKKAPAKGLADFIQYGRPVSDVPTTTATTDAVPVREAPGDVLTLDDASRLVSNLLCAGGGVDVSSSMAELADAEIVQTGEDCVSIIITNPRFVEVMTGPAQAAEVVAESPDSPEPVVVPPEPRRPAFDKPVVYRPDSNPKARRITAKMRSAWAEELATRGQLTCPLPGCLQTFETMTNFRTHYKFCAGTARFEKCLHCSSLIIASKSAMFRHMQVEHPEKMPEGAEPPPPSPERPSEFFLADFDSEVYTEEISARPEKRHVKSSSKENFIRATKKGKGAIFKNKKRVKESLIRNMEEFRKCVRFDSIVDKIKGVEEGVLQSHRAPNSHHRGAHRGRRKPRLFLTSNVVEKEKIFEDDEADDPEAAPESRYDSPVHTKSRLVLPFEPRYKRYSEHLRVSRDWTSERRTYSRSRPSESDGAAPPPRSQRAASVFVTHEEEEAAPVELSLDASLDTSGLSVEHDAFPAASNEVVCGVESEVRAEGTPTIKVERPDRPVTPSAKFIFYGLPPQSEGGIFSRFKAPRVIQRPSKEDGIKLPSRELPAAPPGGSTPTKRGRGRPRKYEPPPPAAPTEAQMCAIGKKIAAKKLKRAKRGRPRKNEYLLSKEAEAKMAVRSTRGGRQGPYGRVHKLSTSHMQALNNIVSNMYRTQKSLALQKRAGEGDLPAFGESVPAAVSETGIFPARTTPITEQLTGVCISPSKVSTPSSAEESASEDIPPAKATTAPPAEQSTDAGIPPAGHETSSPSETVRVSPTKAIVASPFKKSAVINSSPSGSAVTPSPVQEPMIVSISLASASAAEQSSIVSISYKKATTASPVEQSSIVNIPYKKATTTCSVKESTPSERETITKPSTDVVPRPGPKESASNVSRSVEATDEMLTPQESGLTAEKVPERASEVTESTKEDHSVGKDKEVLKQIAVTDSSTTKALEESLSKEIIPPVVATPTPEKKRGRGRPRKVPKEDAGSEKVPEPTVREKEPVPPPVTPDLPSPGIRKSQRARKSKDHSDYVSAITPQKTPKTRSESPRVDTKSPRVDTKSPRVDSKSAGADTPIGKSPVVDTPVVESPRVDAPVGPVVDTPAAESPGVKRKRGRPRKSVSAPPTPVTPDPPKEPEAAARDAEEDTPRRAGGRKSRKTDPRKVSRDVDLETRKKEAEELLSEISAISNSKREEPPAPPLPTEEAEECRCAELTLPLKKRKHQKAPEKRCPHAGTPACSETTKSPSHKKKKEQEKKEALKEIVPDATTLPVQEKVPEESDEIPERRTSKRLSLTKKKSYTSVDSDREDDEEKDKDYVPKEKDKDYVPKEKESLSLASPSTPSHSRRRQISAMKHWKEISVPVLEGGDENRVWDSEKHPFPEFVSRKSSFLPIEPDEQNPIEDFLPPFLMSLNILVDKKSGWTRLARFRSLQVEGVENHWTFFAGGPILCSAFLPIQGDEDQYVLLSVNVSLSKNTYSCASRGRERGQLQLWNLGKLQDRTRLEKRPKMELALCLNHLVHDLAFCPAPSGDNPKSFPPDSDHLPRLGLLASACSDALIRIYAIPHPASICGGCEAPFYSANPVAVLEPLCDERDRSVCSALCWERKGSNARICAGYGSGLVCVYLLRGAPLSESGCLKLSPHACFQAHGAPITSISLAPLPECRFLLTSSLDKVLKFWDLHSDLCAPSFCLFRKGQIRQAHWPAHWGGSFGCLEDGASSLADHFSREAPSSRRNELPLRLLGNHSHQCTKSAVSDFLNAQAIVDMGGSVSVSVLYSPKMSHPANTLVYSSTLEELEDEVVLEDVSLLLSNLLDVVLSVEGMSNIAVQREGEVRMKVPVDDVRIPTGDVTPREVRKNVDDDVRISTDDVTSHEVQIDNVLTTQQNDEFRLNDMVDDVTSHEVQMDNDVSATQQNDEVRMNDTVDDVWIQTEDVPMDNDVLATPQNDEVPMEVDMSETQAGPTEDVVFREVQETASSEGSEEFKNMVPHIQGTEAEKPQVLSPLESQKSSATDTGASENGPSSTEDRDHPSDSASGVTEVNDTASTEHHVEDSVSLKEEDSGRRGSVKQEPDTENIERPSDRPDIYETRNNRDASTLKDEKKDLKVNHKVPNSEIPNASLSPSTESLHHSLSGSPTKSNIPRARLSPRAISKKIQLKYLRPKVLSPFKCRRVKLVNRTLTSHQIPTDHSDKTEVTGALDLTKTEVAHPLEVMPSSTSEVDQTVTSCLDDVKDTVTSLDGIVTVTSCVDDVKATVDSLDDVVTVTSYLMSCIDEQEAAMTCLHDVTSVACSMDEMTSVTSCMDEVEATVTSLDGIASVTSCMDEIEATVTSLDGITSVASCLDEVKATVASLDKIASVTSCMDEIEATVTSLDGIASVASCLDEVEATVTSLDEVMNLTNCVEEMEANVTLRLEREESVSTSPNACSTSNDVTDSVNDVQCHNLDDVEVMVTSCFDEDSVDSLTDEVRVSDAGPTLLQQTLEKNFRVFSQNDCAVPPIDSCSCADRSSETPQSNRERTCAFCRSHLQNSVNSENVSEDSRSERKSDERESRTIVPLSDSGMADKSVTRSNISAGPPHSDLGGEDVLQFVNRTLDSLLKRVDGNENSVVGRKATEKMSIGKRRRLAEIRESPIPKKKSKSVKKLGVREASGPGDGGKEETSEGRLGDLRDYEKMASTRGLVFKDNFNLWKCRTLQSESSTPTEVNNLESLHFDPFGLTSINTVCWNPNFGCRFWICTGAQSGIARISCLADIVPSTKDKS